MNDSTTPSVMPIPPVPYCPGQPTPTQRAFLDRDDREVFFGGAAGGGKSMALLMGALKYALYPGYSALIIRKDFARLHLAGGLIPRSHEWFHGTAARWIADRRQWIFPIPQRPDAPPATIMFGYLTRPLDKFRYASSEFQYIAFDELTDFSEEDYLFLFSRLRRNTSVHAPLRMRSASNPGGPGHAWVKERFVEGAVESRKSKVESQGEATTFDFGLSTFDRGVAVFHKHDRVYIPSRITDNPYLDDEAYRRSLLHLPPVERERLLNGDWQVQEQGQVKQEWLRYFIQDPGDGGAMQIELLKPDGGVLATLEPHACRRFMTVDPAGTSQELAREARGWTPSWSVVQVWEQPRARELARFMILRDQVRRRVSFNDLCSLVRDVEATWRPQRTYVEGERLGRAVYESLRVRMRIELLPTGNADKLMRAAPLLGKFERGEVFFPKYNTTWLRELESELLAWTGDERQPADQIDAAAYAAMVVERQSPTAIRMRMGAVRA